MVRGGDMKDQNLIEEKMAQLSCIKVGKTAQAEINYLTEIAKIEQGYISDLYCLKMELCETSEEIKQMEEEQKEEVARVTQLVKETFERIKEMAISQM